MTKTEDLTGADLERAVDIALALMGSNSDDDPAMKPRPTWSDLVERERINLTYQVGGRSGCFALHPGTGPDLFGSAEYYGPDGRTAALRAFIAVHLGHEVDLQLLSEGSIND